ncbi:hypothetical protein VC116059_003157A, partial [Vibrio cholerae O1 str. 116059]|jgi:hypothetical protein
MHK